MTPATPILSRLSRLLPGRAPAGKATSETLPEEEIVFDFVETIAPGWARYFDNGVHLRAFLYGLAQAFMPWESFEEMRILGDATRPADKLVADQVAVAVAQNLPPSLRAHSFEITRAIRKKLPALLQARRPKNILEFWRQWLDSKMEIISGLMHVDWGCRLYLENDGVYLTIEEATALDSTKEALSPDGEFIPGKIRILHDTAILTRLPRKVNHYYVVDPIAFPEIYESAKTTEQI